MIRDFNAIDTGVFLCTPVIFDALEESQARGDDSISGAMNVLARGSRRASSTSRVGSGSTSMIRSAYRKAEDLLRRDGSDAVPASIRAEADIRPVETAEPVRRASEIEEFTNLWFIHPIASRLTPVSSRTCISTRMPCPWRACFELWPGLPTPTIRTRD